MKKISSVLIVSLVANGALLVAWWRTREPAPAEPASARPVAVARSETGLSEAQARALRAGGEAELAAAGVPRDVIRDLLAGRAYTRHRARLAALVRPPRSTAEYWKGAQFGPDKEQMRASAAIMAAMREYEDELRTLYGDGATPAGWSDPRHATLSEAKRRQVERVEQDYNEMRMALMAEIAGSWLPSDQRKLQLLDQERDRDVRALLTPEEQEQIDLRFSTAAMWVQNTIGAGIENEDEFRKVYALRKALEDRFPANSAAATAPGYWKEREAAETKMNAELRTALGDEAYARVRKAADQELRSMTALERRLALPAGTAENFYRERDRYAEISQAIARDAGLAAEERRRLLAALADQAQGKLQQVFGADAAQALTQQAFWLQLLRSGNAFSTDPTRGGPGFNATVVTPVEAIPAVAAGGGGLKP